MAVSVALAQIWPGIIPVSDHRILQRRTKPPTLAPAAKLPEPPTLAPTEEETKAGILAKICEAATRWAETPSDRMADIFRKGFAEYTSRFHGDSIQAAAESLLAACPAARRILETLQVIPPTAIGVPPVPGPGPVPAGGTQPVPAPGAPAPGPGLVWVMPGFWVSRTTVISTVRDGRTEAIGIDQARRLLATAEEAGRTVEEALERGRRTGATSAERQAADQVEACIGDLVKAAGPFASLRAELRTAAAQGRSAMINARQAAALEVFAECARKAVGKEAAASIWEAVVGLALPAAGTLAIAL